ncbi:nitrate- and nitrite sensing domain-containing protein [Saccharopolyspora sp. MS10]|uniref:sensor histidine kinase n=1 Tax=Saccharopolyspora sp. MS10 TaxID=3385973 RepID=UPI0039A36C3A
MQKLDDWRKGRRSIRDRLYGVVLIPGVALLVLWSIISGITLYDGFHLRGIATGVRDVSLPAMRVLASAQKERTLSLVQLAAPAPPTERLVRQREATDRALHAMREAADPTLEQAPDEVRERMRALNGLIAELPAVRARVDTAQTDRAQVHGYYDGFVEAGSALFQSQARLFPDSAVSQGGLRAAGFFTATDRMSRAASLATDGLRTEVFPAADHLAFAQLTGAYHLELAAHAASADPDVRARFAEITASPQFARLTELENQIIARGPWGDGGEESSPLTPAIDVAEWLTTSDLVTDDLTTLAATQAQRTAAAGIEAGDRNLAQVAIGSVVALLVVLLAILVALRVSRGLSRRLNGLRDDTLVLADGQLPEIVARLRRGERVDIDREVAHLDYGRDEIGQVAEAFNTAQRTAVAAAVQEAQAREGVHTVFLGIAGRSQALVHRLLTMIDRLEREERDPDRMALLFGLDHLATRARRNAENLIILGGGRPGRRWSRPIELSDVLRSAVAETKHYARVRVQRPPDLALHGDAVADTVHLLAELLDNATSFSPPDARVSVHSHAVARGVVVEVEDRGLGIADADRDAANAMLAEPPEFDAMALRSDSRLGLFVVARLADRHGISVELRTSAYGGTRAIVLVPEKLIVEPIDPGPAEARTGQLPRVRSASGDEAEPAPGKSPGAEASADERAAEPAVESVDRAEPVPDEEEAPSWPPPAPAEPTRTDAPEDAEITPSGETVGNDADVTASGDDCPPERGYRSDGGELIEPGRAAAEPPAAWPTEDPAGDPEPVAWPEEPDSVTTDPTGHPPLAGTDPAPSTEDGPDPATTGEEDENSTGPDDEPEHGAAAVPLPRRRRQASMAPELARDRPDGEDEQDEAEPRSPEEVRALMSAIQRGTDRGRRSAEPDADTNDE